jgi:signal transduction histidine kinase
VQSESVQSEVVETPRAKPKQLRWNDRLLFRTSFAHALLETFGIALGLQTLAWLWARTGAAAPGPEFLAFLAEHFLWVTGVLMLRRSSHKTILGSELLAQLWRFARAPIFGALTGAGFALLIWQTSQVLPISRSFYEFQALAVPDASRALEALPALALSTMLRFVFAYAFRAVWLEGRRVLRWRLTALALGGGVLASGVVAVLPNLVTLARDPSRQVTGDALREARDLSVAFEPALRFNFTDGQLQNLLEYLTKPGRARRLRQLESEGDPASKLSLPATIDQQLFLLDPSGQVITSSGPQDASHFTSSGLLSDDIMLESAWAEVLAAGGAGRCRAVNVAHGQLGGITRPAERVVSVANESMTFAGCPVFAANTGSSTFSEGEISPSGRSRSWMIAAVLRPNRASSALGADLIAQVTHDMTLGLDTLSRAFLPIFLALGLLGYAAAQRLTTPFERLLAGSRALQSGQLGARVAVEGDDEIASLGTEFNTMAAQLEASRSELEASLASNRRLTANASHELRTPLAVMRAHLESNEIRGTPLSPQIAKVLANEVARLEHLVEDLFTLSRADLHQLALNLEPVNLGELLHSMTDSLGPLAAQHHVTLLNHTPEGLPDVQADRERLRQVIGNLVHNSLRYTLEGGLVRLEASVIGAGSSNGHVRLSIEDTGIGIETEELEHVFEPFYRTDPARTRATGGAGLGLSLVRELTEAMGGRVYAESQVGRGSRFTLELRISGRID